ARQRGDPGLLEAPDVARRERRVGEVAERRPAPEPERPAQQVRGGLGAAAVRVTASPSPSDLRSRETWTCTVLTDPAAASSPQSATASRSALTGSLGFRRRTAR